MKNYKVSALINAYIELGQGAGYDDSQIIDSLTDIFERKELEEMGFGDFVKDYFEDDDKFKYRVMIGEDGDDFIYQGNLSWDEAYKVFGRVKTSLKPGAYARVELDG